MGTPDALEDRLRAVEDTLAIYHLIASHPPPPTPAPIVTIAMHSPPTVRLILAAGKVRRDMKRSRAL
jgi:hypothetical protein